MQIDISRCRRHRGVRKAHDQPGFELDRIHRFRVYSLRRGKFRGCQPDFLGRNFQSRGLSNQFQTNPSVTPMQQFEMGIQHLSRRNGGAEAPGSASDLCRDLSHLLYMCRVECHREPYSA